MLGTGCEDRPELKFCDGAEREFPVGTCCCVDVYEFDAGAVSPGSTLNDDCWLLGCCFNGSWNEVVGLAAP